MEKISIIGSGNIGLSLARGLVAKNYCSAANITLTRRNLAHLEEEKKIGFQVSSNHAHSRPCGHCHTNSAGNNDSGTQNT